MTVRAPGFYWVREPITPGSDYRWAVAEWTHGRWLTTGGVLDQSYLAEIGPRVESPEAAPGDILNLHIDGVPPWRDVGADLRRLRGQLRAAEEDRDDARQRLAYAHEEIRLLRERVTGTVGQVAAPVDRPRHETDWEDSGVAGILCGGQEAGSLMANDEPRPCDVCGALLRLHWDVRVEIVGPVAAPCVQADPTATLCRTILTGRGVSVSDALLAGLIESARAGDAERFIVLMAGTDARVVQDLWVQFRTVAAPKEP